MEERFLVLPVSRAYRLLHPRPVVIITTRLGERDNAMSASWVTPVSFDPPLVAVSIAPERFTYELLVKSGVFALNVPGEDLLWCVDYVGTISGRSKDKLRALKEKGVKIGRGRRLDVPVLLDSLAVLECEVYKKVEAGDHVLFIGKVVECYARKDLFVGGVYVEGVSPLMHVGGDLYSIAEKRFKP